MHRMGSGHVTEDHFQYSLLRVGETKRQHLVDAADEWSWHDGQTVFFDHITTTKRHAKLQIKQFVKYDRAVGQRACIVERRKVRFEWWHMEPAQCLIKIHQTQSFTNFRRDSVG